MHSWCEISQSALKNNLEIFRDFLAPACAAPVLKSNAYGHGLKEVYRAIAPLKPEILCVNYLFEARQLRILGYEGRLVSVGPSFSAEFPEASALSVELTIGSEELLDSWVASSEKPECHLKFDTGLSRQGVAVERAGACAEKLLPFSQWLKGITSHFANVEDVTSQGFALSQLNQFLEADAVLKKAGLNYERHMAASAPSLLLKSCHFDFCRLGISFYGFWPSASTRLSFLSENRALLDLKPALTWKTKIASVRKVKKGVFVGYGCTFRAPRDMTIAVVPVGYYEGLPRQVSNSGAYFLAQGQRCSLLGRICMNMSVIDVSALKEPSEGEELVLLGQDQSEYLSAEDLAAWAGTIQYDLVTRIPGEVPRHLIENGETAS